MAGFAELLASVLDLDKNAQTNLPVLPNNGNPAGAYNMPVATGGNTPAQAMPKPQLPNRDLSWMQPSPYMRNVQDMLNRRRTEGSMPPQPAPQMGAGGVMPPQTQPTMRTGGGAQVSPATPTLPARFERPEMPIALPQRRRINEYVP